DRQDDAGDVTGVRLRREEDVCGRDLLRLRRPLEWDARAELRDLLRRAAAIGRVQRCPHRAGCDRVDADALVDELLREHLRELVDRALRRGVVGQLLAAAEAGRRARRDDRGAWWH